MTLHPRKSQRVYRSPSNPNDPSPYAKCVSAADDYPMDMDAEDKEAGTILMALAQHANRNHPVLNTIEEKPTQSRSTMSIRNLLDDSSSLRTSGLVSPYRSLSSGARPFYESRRQNSLKKGIKICLAQRSTYMEDEVDEEKSLYTFQRRNNAPRISFRRPDTIKHSTRKSGVKSVKKSTLHIHISYRIHAHITSSDHSKSRAAYSEVVSKDTVQPQRLYETNKAAFSASHRTQYHNTGRMDLKSLANSRRRL